MDESAIKATKAIEGLQLNGSDAFQRRISSVMMVSGYDTSLAEDELKKLLSEHFASCGKITLVYLPINLPLKIRNKYAFVHVLGEDAEEKALKLNGSDFGGRKLRVELKPPSNNLWNVTPELAAMRADQNEQLRRTCMVIVTGYDPSVPKEENKRVLIKHFSSCGEVQFVDVIGETSCSLNKKAVLHMVGDDVAEKVQALNGCDMGGWIAKVVHCRPGREIKFDRVIGVPIPEKNAKKAKITSE